MMYRVFYGMQVYGEYSNAHDFIEVRRNLPDDVIICSPELDCPWFNKHYTPIEDDDVPAYIRYLQLVLPN